MTLLLQVIIALAVFSIVVLSAEFYCPNVATKGTDRRTNTSNFRVVQFNAEWLFVDGFDNCPGTTCPWKIKADADKHLSSIAKVISDLNPDLVNLCEVESCDELTLLTQNSLLSSRGYKPYMIQGTDSSTGQDNGMLTKVDPTADLIRTEARVSYPIPGTTCSSPYTGTYGVSKHYITTFKINGMDIVVVSVHLLAFPDDQTRCVEREAQATVIQQALDPYISKGYEAIVLGDINDWDAQVLDSNNNKPISSVADILKGKGKSWTLTNVASKLTTSERYSEWYDENDDCVYSPTENSMIDHIFVSKGLLNKVTNVFIAHSEYAQSCNDFYYSDHWPVVVDFKI